MLNIKTPGMHQTPVARSSSTTIVIGDTIGAIISVKFATRINTSESIANSIDARLYDTKAGTGATTTAGMATTMLIMQTFTMNNGTSKKIFIDASGVIGDFE